MEKRYHTIDCIKGIMIFLVLVTHYEFTDQERLFFFFPFVVDMAIPVFMFLSGYTYAVSFEKHGIASIAAAYECKNIIGRIVRYTIPFLCLILWFLVDSNIEVPRNLLSFLKWVIDGTSGKGSYYYPILIQLQFVFPVIYFIVSGKTIYKGLWICFAINATYELLRWAYGIGEDSYRLLVFRYTFVVAAGVFAYKRNRIKLFPGLIITAIGMVFIIFTTYCGYVPKILTFWTSTCFVASMWITPVMVWILQNTDMNFAPLEIVGRASYHIFWVQMVYYLVYYDKVGVLLPNRFIHLCAGIIICLIMGVLFYYVERPVSRKLSKWAGSILA